MNWLAGPEVLGGRGMGCDKAFEQITSECPACGSCKRSDCYGLISSGSSVSVGGKSWAASKITINSTTGCDEDCNAAADSDIIGHSHLTIAGVAYTWTYSCSRVSYPAAIVAGRSAHSGSLGNWVWVHEAEGQGSSAHHHASSSSHFSSSSSTKHTAPQCVEVPLANNCPGMTENGNCQTHINWLAGPKRLGGQGLGCKAATSHVTSQCPACGGCAVSDCFGLVGSISSISLGGVTYEASSIVPVSTKSFSCADRCKQNILGHGHLTLGDVTYTWTYTAAS